MHVHMVSGGGAGKLYVVTFKLDKAVMIVGPCNITYVCFFGVGWLRAKKRAGGKRERNRIEDREADRSNDQTRDLSLLSFIQSL